jgi:Sulfotransferase family
VTTESTAKGSGSAHPVFVGGTGRSGTTILARLVGAHADYKLIPIELRFQVEEKGLFDLLHGKASFEEFAGKMENHWYRFTTKRGEPRGLAEVGIPWQRVEEALARLERGVAGDPTVAAGQFVRELLNPFGNWVEMTPGNIRGADLIAAMLPEARIIHTVRDGRDVACSVVTRPWGPDNPLDALEWWADEMRAANTASRGVNVLVVHLEDLSERAREETLEAVFAFLGTEPDASARAFFEDRVGNFSHIGRWRELPPDERDRLDSRYEELLRELRDEQVPFLPAVR